MTWLFHKKNNLNKPRNHGDVGICKILKFLHRLTLVAYTKQSYSRYIIWKLIIQAYIPTEILPFWMFFASRKWMKILSFHSSAFCSIKDILANEQVMVSMFWLICRGFRINTVRMGLLPDAHNCGLRMRRECREHFPRHRLQRKPLVSDPAMHHSTCVAHVPWCMSGSLARGGGENVLGIPGACATRNFTYLARGPLFEIS